MQSSSAEFVDADSKLFTNIILARPLSENTTVATMKDLFPGAMEIAFPRQVLGARYATCIVYSSHSACLLTVVICISNVSNNPGSTMCFLLSVSK